MGKCFSREERAEISQKFRAEIKNRRLYLTEINPASSLEDIKQTTEADFEIALK